MKLERNFVLAIAILVCVALSPTLASAQSCTIANCPAGYTQITSPPFIGFLPGVSYCMIGTSGNDNMIGGSQADYICGNGGSDVIIGNAGDDFIDGGDGGDMLFGEAGFDTIFGGADNDTINGGDDADFLFGDAGDDVINGDGGADWLFGNAGDDTLNGGDDPDRIFGGSDDDTIDGQGGDDPQLSGGDGNDTVNGGDGDDTIFGDAGTDQLNGGEGADDLNGGTGPDILNGDGDDDDLNGGTDNDTLIGGAGSDDFDGGGGEDNCLIEPGEPHTGCELFSHAALSSFEAINDGGGVVIRWTTSSESGTVGFYLFKEVDGVWEAAHEGLLPGLLTAPQGGVYEIHASSGGRYLLQELDMDGAINEYGPFDVTPGPGEVAVLADGEIFARRAHAINVSRRAKANGAALESAGLATTVHVGISKTGVYSVTADQIASFLARDVTTVRSQILAGEFDLTEGGQSVGWSAAADGSEMVFVAFESESIYSNERVFTIAPTAGTSMLSVDATPGALAINPSFYSVEHFEVNELAATVVAPDPAADYWFWQLMSATPSMTENANVMMELKDVVTDRRDATVHIKLQGVSNEVHRVGVVVNGMSVGTLLFEGVVPYSESVSVPAALLVEGTNTLELETRGGPKSLVFLDFVELSYERSFVADDGGLAFTSDDAESIEITGLAATSRIFDVTNRRLPVELLNVALDGSSARFGVASSASYLATETIGSPDSIWGDVPSSWRSESNNADYVLIAPAEFVDSANALASHRASQGYQTAVVELQDIYDEFSAGQLDPLAIKAFVEYAHYNWDLPPRFVTLVGDGSFDYRDYDGLGGNFVPPLMVRTSKGLFASDMRFGDFEADGLSDIAIGRLPVSTVTELDSVVAQLIAYDAQSEDRFDSVVFVADASDPISDFAAASDVIAETLPASFDAERVYRGAEDIANFNSDASSGGRGFPKNHQLPRPRWCDFTG